MTTAQEIDWGRAIAREIQAQEGRVDDPLLDRWVGDVGKRLLVHVARTDVPYALSVVNSEDVNAFSIPGGFVFVDVGLLNFVHSDDELAAVLAHEIGHVERRHIVTLTEKAKALEIILDVAGLFAPAVNRFGNLAADLVLYKSSRVDELQADQYGLMLMSQAGYDRDAMAAFLQRLESTHPEHNSLLGRYFETHPALPNRIAHLRGYPALDRPSPDALLAQGLHDETSGQFFAARAKLARVLGLEPGNRLAREHQAALAAIFEPPPARKVPALPQNAERAAAAGAAAERAAAALKAQITAAGRDLDEYQRYLDSVGFYVDAQSRTGIERGSRLDRILSGQVRIAQSMDHSYDEVSQTIDQAQELADDDVKLADDLKARVAKPDREAPVDGVRMAKLIARSEEAHVRLSEAALAARGAMAVGRDRGKVIARFLDAFDAVSGYKGGDMSAADYYKLQTPLRQALIAAKQAAGAADVGARLLNDGESLQIMDRIDMAAVDADPARLASFGALLNQRFGPVAGRLPAGVLGARTPAEIAAAAVIAAETNRPLQASLALFGDQPAAPLDAAARLDVRPETMQLELGLVWVAYSDGQL